MPEIAKDKTVAELLDRFSLTTAFATWQSQMLDRAERLLADDAEDWRADYVAGMKKFAVRMRAMETPA